MFESVNSVLTTFLGSLYIAIFFSGNTNTASLIGSKPRSVEPSCSNMMWSFAFARLASDAFNCIKLVVLLFVNSISAVKSCPASSSSTNNCLACENENVSILEIVKSALDEFSISALVSAESDAISFSPVWNVPTTFVKRTWFAVPVDVSPSSVVSKTNPVAPDVLPFNCTPLECVAVNNGLGVPLKLNLINVLKSNRYAL